MCSIGGGEIGLLDGFNCTTERRKLILDRVALEDGYEVLWIESIRDSVEAEDMLLYGNMQDSPDYYDRDDFLQKMFYYKSIYQTVTKEEGRYVKIFGCGHTTELHAIGGFLMSKIASFLMNLQPVPKPVYMTRHGESVYNVKGQIGGDSALSPRGTHFAEALAAYISTKEAAYLPSSELCVWTSIMRRSKETAQKLNYHRVVEWRALREIEVGVCDGLTYEEVQEKFPDEYKARDVDKLRYRYPRGESYVDVINRLEPVIFELERQTEPLLIIGHQAVLRCLYAYFFDLPVDEIPYLSIPLHTLIRLDPRTVGKYYQLLL